MYVNMCVEAASCRYLWVQGVEAAMCMCEVLTTTSVSSCRRRSSLSPGCDALSNSLPTDLLSLCASSSSFKKKQCSTTPGILDTADLTPHARMAMS